MKTTTCNHTQVYDTDTGQLEPACSTHRHYLPCPHDGEPPLSGLPLHVFPGQAGTREEAIEYGRSYVGGARDLIVHNETDNVRDHDPADDASCWCGPEVTR